jgi:hypothetical protein
VPRGKREEDVVKKLSAGEQSRKQEEAFSAFQKGPECSACSLRDLLVYMVAHNPCSEEDK